MARYKFKVILCNFYQRFIFQYFMQILSPILDIHVFVDDVDIKNNNNDNK